MRNQAVGLSPAPEGRAHIARGISTLPAEMPGLLEAALLSQHGDYAGQQEGGPSTAAVSPGPGGAPGLLPKPWCTHPPSQPQGSQAPSVACQLLAGTGFPLWRGGGEAVGDLSFIPPNAGDERNGWGLRCGTERSGSLN